MIQAKRNFDRQNGEEWAHVLFQIQSCMGDDAVFIRLQPSVGQARLIPLERVDESGRWEVRLELRPDTYRYRYYRKTGSTIMYHPPQPEEGEGMGPWDAVLKIPAFEDDTVLAAYGDLRTHVCNR